MGREKNLDTIIKSERKRIQMVPGELVLEPKGKRIVQLENGGYAEINDEGLRVETEGEFHMGYHSKLLDPANEKDARILDGVAKLLEDRPDYATSVDFQIKIIGEYDITQPWPGYDDQSAEQLEAYWAVMPDQSRPALENVMKYELSRVDEEGDSITDEDKVKVINKLYREAAKAEAVSADQGVAL